MATLVSDVVAGLRDDLRGSVLDTYLTDTQLAGLVGTALSQLNSKVASASFVVTGKESGRVILTSAFTPEVTLESAWGYALRLAAVYQLAVSGALVRAEKLMGAYSAPSHSANDTQRAQQMRLNTAMLKADLDDAVAGLNGFRTHVQGTVDYSSYITP